MRHGIFIFFLALALPGCDLVPFDLPHGMPGVLGCKADADCDDRNPCTLDTCSDGACVTALVDQGVACSDGDQCHGPGACDGMGRCQPGPPLVACTSPWTPTSTAAAPSPRQRHTALWTGSSMIVWGGLVSGQPSVTATGGVFDPKANTWKPMSTASAPPPRHSHRAVWTGTKMIVWGGAGAVDLESTGGIYDPASDTWTPMSTASAPSGRVQFSMVWTGDKLVVFGGLAGTVALGDGGIYDPASDTWTKTAAAGAPSQRFDHTAVWTGTRMIVWGGNDLFDWHQDGVLFDPAPPSGVWATPTSLMSTPAAREGHTGLWTGSAMLIWGGWTGGPYVNTGALYDPALGTQGAWAPISTAGAPAERAEHAAIWAGDKLFVWGGCNADACSVTLGDGGVWTPGVGGGAWTKVAEDANLGARKRHTAVWTGSEAIVWGGLTDKGVTDSGAMIMP